MKYKYIYIYYMFLFVNYTSVNLVEDKILEQSLNRKDPKGVCPNSWA